MRYSLASSPERVTTACNEAARILAGLPQRQPGRACAKINIEDDDPIASLRVSDATVKEGNPGVPDPTAINRPLQRQFAEQSAQLPLDEIDRCPKDLFNRILWHAQKASRVPYPERAVTAGAD